MALEDYGISTGVLPTGGGGEWVYKQEGLQELLRAPDPQKLCQLIMAHRINAGKPVGNVEEDLADFIRKTSPQNDRFRRHSHALIVTPKAKPITPLIERIKAWLISKQEKRLPKLTDNFTAIQRAEICAQCAQNIPWRTSCGECNSDVVYRGDMVRQTTQFQYDKKLRACRKANLYLPAAVLMDQDELPKKDEDFPSACWLLK